MTDRIITRVLSAGELAVREIGSEIEVEVKSGALVRDILDRIIYGISDDRSQMIPRPEDTEVMLSFRNVGRRSQHDFNGEMFATMLGSRVTVYGSASADVVTEKES